MPPLGGTAGLLEFLSSSGLPTSATTYYHWVHHAECTQIYLRSLNVGFVAALIVLAKQTPLGHCLRPLLEDPGKAALIVTGLLCTAGTKTTPSRVSAVTTHTLALGLMCSAQHCAPLSPLARSASPT